MQPELADILACPVDKAPLALAVERTGDGDGDDVIEGTLACASCGAAYPIRGGIPNLLPPDYPS